MPKKKTKKSVIEQQYNRERRRVQAAINRAKKQGYQFDKSPLPPKPKKITKASVTRLQKITPTVIRKSATSNIQARVTTTRKPLPTKPTKPVNTLYQEYVKNANRIRAFMKSAKDRGFVWLENPLPEYFGKLTRESSNAELIKAVTDLKALTPDTLYTVGEWVDPTTGEIVPAVEGLKLIKQQAAAKRRKTIETPPTPEIPIEPTFVLEDIPESELPFTEQPSPYVPSFSQVVLANFYDVLDRCENGAAAPIIREWVDLVVLQYGENAAANMIQQAAENGVQISFAECYSVPHARTFMNETLRYLNADSNTLSNVDTLLEESEWWELPD